MRKGFTLVELIIVIIIVGILASVGLTQYTALIEKGRGAEARTVLGSIRTQQVAYFVEYGAYTANLALLNVGVPAAACATTHYFRYACVVGGTCTATRCTAAGKTPNNTVAWIKTLTMATAVWGGTAGY